MLEHQKKLDKLIDSLRSMECLAVAFSGGVDSTFLLKVAHDILKDRVLAVTARSSIHPEDEFREAMEFIEQNGIRHQIIVSNELDIDGFKENPADRCYYCKRELYSMMVVLARQKGILNVADGSNIDDLGDYRPGARAGAELGIISPLQDAKMTKEDIRILSKEMNLPTWDKPALACLASRIPYGQKITREKLTVIEQAERILKSHGFRQVRVRHHGDLARIEVVPEERMLFFNTELMDAVYDEFRKLGFSYAALDLRGYRTGSLNETLS